MGEHDEWEVGDFAVRVRVVLPEAEAYSAGTRFSLGLTSNWFRVRGLPYMTSAVRGGYPKRRCSEGGCVNLVL